jgi:acyl-CoA thioester hydrolase
VGGGAIWPKRSRRGVGGAGNVVGMRDETSESTFRVSLTVRSSDLDANGHVRGSVYLDYADHARWEWLRAAGVSLDDLREAGLGPVSLETTIRWLEELRPGDSFTVTAAFRWGEGKTGTVVQELRRSDGTLVAEVTGVGGLLDLERRRLVPDPRSHWRTVATHPHLLGL